MNTKTKIIIAFILCLSIIAVATAAYWIYSNIVTVTVTEYILELEASNTQVSRYTNITFMATLTIDYMIPVEDASINLLKNDQVIDTRITDSQGIAEFTVNMTDTMGAYNFKAAYQAP